MTGTAGVAHQPMDKVQSIATGSGSSFLTAMRLLPKARRQAIYAVYAFCREVDDIADGDALDDDKRRQLGAWRQRIDRLFEPREATPNSPAEAGPITAALAGPIEEYDLKRADFLAIIDGMDMDAGAGMRGPSWPQLELYCARVAGAVGRLLVRIFGATGADAEDVARYLGEALQLTNILRDIHEDALDGRLYLPAELLDAHGIEGREPRQVIAEPALQGVCGDMVERARQRFTEARAAIARCDRAAMRPAKVMMHIYARVLDRLVARGWDKLEQPVRVSAIEKLAIGLRHGIL